MIQSLHISSMPTRGVSTAETDISSYLKPLGILFTASALIYLGIYAFEGAIRYGLFLVGKDSLILVRDALIIAPLVLLFAIQAMRLKVHPAFWITGALFAFHGLVLMGTIGSYMGVAYGVKILMNLLFGYFMASLLTHPSERVLKIFVIIWCITLVGVCLDKFGVSFPWVGIKTVVGDIDVDVSKDWEIVDPLQRRVAGFTRSSIAVAAMMPLLTIVMLSRIKGAFLRVVVAIAGVTAVALTTQKGALFAIAPIAAIQCLPPTSQSTWMKTICLTFIALSAALPLITWSIHISHGTGVFSTESLYIRIVDTWPDAIEWIRRHQLALLGVGLGGLGGPQRFYAANSFNPADNIMLLLYAYFGIFAVIYVAIICVLVVRSPAASFRQTVPALAIVAFAFGYGAVLSILENQVITLFLGGALSVLWSEMLKSNPVNQFSRPPIRTFKVLASANPSR